LKLAFYIGKRYLFAKETQNVINIISGISVSGVAVSTAALIIILSVFNGFDNLVKGLFNSFDPDIKIMINEGKTFRIDEPGFKQIKKIPQIDFFCEVVEENALLEYNDKQFIATIKGVSPNFKMMNGIDTMIVEGKYELENDKYNSAVLGYGVAYYLSVGVNLVTPVKIWVPKRNEKITFDAEKAFNNDMVIPSGIFSIQQEYDSKYILVNINFARELLEYTTEVSSVEIKLKPNANQEKVKREIQKILGPSFSVKNRFEQHELLFKIMKSEKWAIFLILSFILLIASFNVTGSLTMLIVDKKNDILTLRNMGADNKLIRNIFLIEGWLISIMGAVIGLILGWLVCFIQHKFELITFPTGSTFVISAYPVDMYFPDFIYVFATVIFIGFIAAWYPVNYINRKHLKNSNYS